MSNIVSEKNINFLCFSRILAVNILFFSRVWFVKLRIIQVFIRIIQDLLALFAYKILGTKRKIQITEVFELQKFELSTFYCIVIKEFENTSKKNKKETVKITINSTYIRHLIGQYVLGLLQTILITRLVLRQNNGCEIKLQRIQKSTSAGVC
jgi:hypothetical protein